MTKVNSLDALLKPCNCEPKYTIERHGKGYVLYYGRCMHKHGYNLVYMTDPAANFDPAYIERLINLGKTIAEMTDRGSQ